MQPIFKMACYRLRQQTLLRQKQGLSGLCHPMVSHPIQTLLTILSSFCSKECSKHLCPGVRSLMK